MQGNILAGNKLPTLFAENLKYIITELIHTVRVERGIKIINTKVKTLEMAIKNKKSVRKVS